MKHDPLADLFSVIKNAESIGKNGCTVPASTLFKNILKVMQDHEYIGEFEFVDDGRGGKFNVKLLGNINSCNVIRPRFSVGFTDFIRWEKRFLPADNIGILILTTPKGVMDQIKAKKEKIGGKLLGFVY